MRSCNFLILILSSPLLAAPPCPSDLGWLRKEVGDGALAYSDGKKIRLVELSTNMTVTVGPGRFAEFSPDSSKLAWVDGKTIKGRMRTGDTSIRTLAVNVDPEGAVHWLSNTELAAVLRKGKQRAWYRISLDGKVQPVPELNRLWSGGRECDVKKSKDGHWSLVASRTWKTSEGKSGPIGGGCSCSLSPDGKSITALQGGHKKCTLRRIRKGGVQGELVWKYDGSFDNHRWSSNAPGFVSCVDEKTGYMIVMQVGTSKATRLGAPFNPKNKREVYGDFTRGNGKGTPWPKLASIPGADLKEPAPVKAQPYKAREIRLSNTWPANHDELIFLYENHRKSNEVLGPGRPPRQCSGQLRGYGTVGRFYELQLHRGTYFPKGIDALLFQQCTRSHQLTIEATLKADGLKQRGPARIISFSSNTSARDFTLGQEANQFVMRLRTPRTGNNGSKPQTMFGKINPDKWQHIIATYRPGLLEAYVDGKQVISTRKIQGDFSNWSPQHAIFGDEHRGGRNWAGHLEGVAIYSRFMEQKEAMHHHRLYADRLKNRKPIPTHKVTGRLVEATATPEVADIAPYRRCLAEYVYEVPDNGQAVAGRITVMHWCILDGQKLKLSKKTGQTYQLKLQDAKHHPQLDRERRMSDIDELDLPVFLDVGL